MAQHLGLFDDVIASDGIINMRSHNKAQKLVALFGEKKFGYVGNSRHDLPVWDKALEIIVVNAPARILKNLRQNDPSFKSF